MNAGLLDRNITLMARSITRNSYGEEIIVWNESANVQARRMEFRGNERWAAMQVVAELGSRYIIRYRSDVSVMDRLRDGGKEYDITAVLELGRRRYLELYCTARGE